MAELPVTFFHPPSSAWRTFEQIQADEDGFSFNVQENWVVQTYLRLRDAGYAVALSSSLPTEGIVVYSPGCRFAMRRAFEPQLHGRLTLVAARGDLLPSYSADFEILQNGRFADGRRTFFVPHWPQPGLVPRDPSRNGLIRTAAYLGSSTSLDPVFRSSAWRDFLNEHGIEWQIGFSGDRLADYREIDLLFAVRHCNSLHRHLNKPASKLVNAWTAGVPALLGPEYAFRELRRSRLDYIEVSSLEDAKRAVNELVDNSGLYEDMVQNGHARAEAFRSELLTERWAELLFEVIPRSPVRLRRLRAKLSLQTRGILQFTAQPSFGGHPPSLLFGKAYRYTRKVARKLLKGSTDSGNPPTHHPGNGRARDLTEIADRGRAERPLTCLTEEDQ